MRVALVDHSATWSGAQLNALRLVTELAHCVEFHVILNESGPLASAMRAAGAVVHDLDRAPDGIRRGDSLPKSITAGSRSVLGAGRVLFDTLKLIRPQIVHTNSSRSLLQAGPPARLLGLPLLAHLHDRLSQDYSSQRLTQILRVAYSYLPNLVVANSPSTAHTLRDGTKFEVIPSGIPQYNFAPETRTVIQNVGIFGRLSPWKGQELFLQAFASVFKDTSVRARVVGGPLFGEGVYEKELKCMVSALQIADQVDFLGHVENAMSHTCDMDIVVHSSRIPEPFGQTVFEALSVGVPVIAADAGGPRDYLRHEVDALLTPLSDAAALEAALRRLAGDVALRRRLSVNGRATSSNFATDIVAQRLFMVYEKMLK